MENAVKWLLAAVIGIGGGYLIFKPRPPGPPPAPIVKKRRKKIQAPAPA